MKKTPARLNKVNDSYSYFNSYMISDRIDAWCTRHFTFCLCILLLAFSIIFVMLCYAVVGMSATDSGWQYNQLENII